MCQDQAAKVSKANRGYTKSLNLFDLIYTLYASTTKKGFKHVLEPFEFVGVPKGI